MAAGLGGRPWGDPARSDPGPRHVAVRPCAPNGPPHQDDQRDRERQGGHHARHRHPAGDDPWHRGCLLGQPRVRVPRPPRARARRSRPRRSRLVGGDLPAEGPGQAQADHPWRQEARDGPRALRVLRRGHARGVEQPLGRPCGGVSSLAGVRSLTSCHRCLAALGGADRRAHRDRAVRRQSDSAPS